MKHRDDSADVIAKVETWVEEVGRSKALSEMTKNSISAKVADEIVKGRYVRKPSPMLRTLLIKSMHGE